MRSPVQRSALKQRSECVAEERETEKTECICVGEETRSECMIARMYGYSVKT